MTSSTSSTFTVFYFTTSIFSFHSFFLYCLGLGFPSLPLSEPCALYLLQAGCINFFQCSLELSLKAFFSSLLCDRSSFSLLQSQSFFLRPFESSARTYLILKISSSFLESTLYFLNRLKCQSYVMQQTLIISNAVLPVHLQSRDKLPNEYVENRDQRMSLFGDFKSIDNRYKLFCLELQSEYNLASRIAMQLFQNSMPTFKPTCDYYQTLLKESNFIEQELSTFGSLLSKSYISLTLRETNWAALTLPETKQLKGRIWAMMDKIKEKLHRECTVIVEVTSCVRKVSLEFKQLIDLMRNEQQRSVAKLADLEECLRLKEKELVRCERVVEDELSKQAEQSWRKLHYVKQSNFSDKEVAGLTYAKVIRDLKAKLTHQLNEQRKEQAAFAANVASKLKDFKSKIFQIWYVLPHFGSDSPSEPSVVQERELREISQLERRYLLREQEVDEFQEENLVQIKKKLKLLEEADMSESRQHLAYSESSEGRHIETSDVELFISHRAS